MKHGEKIKKYYVEALIGIITVSRALLFFIPHNVCRFYPSCTAYAKDAVRAFPFYKAVFLIVKRIVRCHPFSKGGYDPVTDL